MAPSAGAETNCSVTVTGTLKSEEHADYAFMAASPRPFFTEEENQRRSRVIVLGQTVARELFGEQSPIGEMVKVNKIGFQVIGILPEKGATAWRDQDDLAVIPVITAMRRVLGKDFVDSVDIEVKDAESLEPVQEKVNELVMRLHRLPPSQKDSFDVRNMAELQAALTETSRTMTWLLGSIAAVSLIGNRHHEHHAGLLQSARARSVCAKPSGLRDILPSFWWKQSW